MYRGIEDEDPSSHLVGDEALAVACTAAADKFYVSAADTNNVQGGNSKEFFRPKKWPENRQEVAFDKDK